MSPHHVDQRADLRQRLRRLGLVRGAGSLPASARCRVAIESLVAGAFQDTPHGRCFLVQADLPADEQHGNLHLGAFLDLAPQVLATVGGEPALAEVDRSRTLFLDTETTGLSGGAGTMAFLVGLGFFEGNRFRLLQTFLRDPGDELAMVHFLGEFLPRFQAVVTFNGRGFDLPILENRFILARHCFPLAALPHLDLLIPARRLWREQLASCALGALEREVLGVQRDQMDVPGGMIPCLYRDYLRSGDARYVAPILYHNRVDILSMVTLAARLCSAFAAPQAEPGLSAVELYSLSRWYDGAGGDGEEALRAALAVGLPQRLRWRALRDLAARCKREGRLTEAIACWQQLALEDRQGVLAVVELAKAFEWRLNQPALAAAWTRLALGRVDGWPTSTQREQQLSALRQRLRRLERRVAMGGDKTRAVRLENGQQDCPDEAAQRHPDDDVGEVVDLQSYPGQGD